MQRDMDLVREILILTAASNTYLDAKSVGVNEDDFQQVAYNIDIMKQAGLVDASISKEWGGKYVSATVKSLTWEGNDFLDAIKSDSVWKNVKHHISKVADTVPFEVIKSVAIKFITEQLL